MESHLSFVRKTCKTLKALLSECAFDAEAVATLKPRPVTDRRRLRTAARRPFRPLRASGFVAAVRGVAEKNARDLPRVLREASLSVGDRDTLLDGLRAFDRAAKARAGVIRARAGKEAPVAKANGPAAWVTCETGP